jgi:prephenate dehydratase
MIVAIQGEAASFHHAAALKLLGPAIQLLSCNSFARTFETLMNGQADYAVVATANTSYGAIDEVSDLLNQYRPHLLSKLWLPVEQCLIGLAGAHLADITHIYSHPVALQQCYNFLQTHLSHTKLVKHADTAGAVSDIVAWQDKSKAAVASELAAKEYDLPILARQIQNDPHNQTHFILLGRTTSFPA